MEVVDKILADVDVKPGGLVTPHSGSVALMETVDALLLEVPWEASGACDRSVEGLRILNESLQARRGTLISQGTTAVFWVTMATLGLLTSSFGDLVLSRVNRLRKVEGALEAVDGLLASSFFDVVRPALPFAATHVAEWDVAALDV